jgi:tetratricopeptide (TPR) repeat protein
MKESSHYIMPTNRIEALQQILAQNPANPLARYGLAMEHVKAGEYQAAVDEFRILLDADPDYTYAYFHAAQTLEKLGRLEEAKGLYRRGIEAAGRKADTHARDELQAALESLES